MRKVSGREQQPLHDKQLRSGGSFVSAYLIARIAAVRWKSESAARDEESKARAANSVIRASGDGWTIVRLALGSTSSTAQQGSVSGDEFSDHVLSNLLHLRVYVS